MGLSIGARLGPYEILSPLGAGGMGEVYKARDTRLDRAVAIKVLASETADDPEFRARFHREAKAIAALTHPHICTLHDVGHHDGIDFLVMELVEGDTLAARLRSGPLPLDKALAYAIDVADALDKAHRAGIVHRDLKPSNVMLTKAGAKLMDFGIARMHPVAGSAVASATAMPTESAPLTGRGDILGTVHYMAPEVLEGRPADARSDIFAFGALLYELATGRRAFDGSSQATVIAAILSTEPPPLLTLQPRAPAALEHVIASCLAKDPDQRWQSIADVKRELLWVRQTGSISKTASSVPRRALGLREPAWLLAGVALGLAGAMLLTRRDSTQTVSTAPARFEIRLDAGWQVQGRPAISPDGSRIVYAARPSDEPDGQRLYVRALDRVAPVVLDGTVGAAWPFFSPDGQWIGYFHAKGLSMVATAGGVPIPISTTGHLAIGGSWTGDGHILFAPTVFSGLRRVSVKGGTLETLTTPSSARGEVGHMFPEVLPDDKAVLLTITNADSFESSKIAVHAFGGGQARVLLDGGKDPRYISSGHLVYARGSTLMAVPFDVQTRQIHGTPVAVLDEVRHSTASHFAVARSGTLVYTEGAEETNLSTPVWIAGDGRVVHLANAVVGEYFDPRISPDGGQIAVSVRVGHNQDIWVHDIARGTWLRLTQDPATDMAPVWIAGGSRIVYSSRSGESVDLFSVPSDGAGEPEALFKSDGWKFASSWSESQKVLAFQESGKGVYGAVGSDVWMLNLAGPPRAEPFIRSRFSEGSLAISPSGRWVAYQSDESGRREVYVRPLRGPGRKWQISTDGGQHPRWSVSEDELLYVNGSRLMTTAVRSDPDFTAGTPRQKATADYYGGVSVPNYDISRDGRLLLMQKVAPPPPARRLIVVQDWIRELKRRVPN